jgi:hypothetical protein
MEHPGGVTGLTPGVTAWTAESIASLPPGERRTMAALVDEAGARSARAQALPTAITSTVRERKKSLFFSRKNGAFFLFRRRRFAFVPSSPPQRRVERAQTPTERRPNFRTRDTQKEKRFRTQYTSNSPSVSSFCRSIIRTA